MQVFLVLGKRLLPSGRLERNFEEAIKKGVELIKLHGELDRDGCRLVISGGVTRAPFPSEARAALDHIPQGFHSSILLEEKSQSTLQNVRYVQRLLEEKQIEFDLIHVISTPGHLARVHKLFKKEWPDAASRVIPVSVGEPNFWDSLANKILGFITEVDPHEKVLLPIRRALIRCRFT